jgi:hypothetical protein
MGERLGRVERLLETLVAKISEYETEDKVQKDILTPESISNDDLTTFNSNTSGVSVSQDTTPFMSLFDNHLVSLSCLILESCSP